MRGRAALCLFAVLCASRAQAFSLDLPDGGSIEWVNKFSFGAGLRTEARDDNLIGKLNVPGQQHLCEPDDCISFNGDPEPNNRLKHAKGGYFLHNNDNGDLNYDQGDFYTTVSKFDSKMTLRWDEWTFKASFLGFFDAVNANFDEHHTNTLYQPAHDAREGEIERRLAVRGEIRELFAARGFDLGEHRINVAVGWQRLRWGEANLTLLNTLDFINPPDAVLARQPGLPLNELNLPTGMVVVDGDLTDTINAQFFYQLDWDPARPEPAGSYFSTSDVAGGGRYAIIAEGQYPEDPDHKYVSQGETSLISSSTRTIDFPGDSSHPAPDSGQYGLRVNWLAESLNQTEFGFYFSNYHSRLPYLSAISADRSCTRDAAVPGNFAAAFVACQGFNGKISQLLGLPLGKEPLPVDTMKLFLEYPENIQLFGISFATNIGSWSVSGEYSFRPNLPVQILQSDVVFAALQPAFPPEDIPLDPAGIPVPLPIPVVGDTLPSARHYLPDYISRYRHHDIGADEYVRGYERLKVGQFTLTGIRLLGPENWVGADSFLMVGEVGFTNIFDKPDGIYFQGAGDETHPSPGADEGNTLRVNPTRMKSGWATDFSWGVRALLQAGYENFMDSGVNLKPTLFVFQDITGIAPSPMQNYVAGNRWLIPSVFAEIGKDWSAAVLYEIFDGDRNLLADRDNLSFLVSYSF